MGRTHIVSAALAAVLGLSCGCSSSMSQRSWFNFGHRKNEIECGEVECGPSCGPTCAGGPSMEGGPVLVPPPGPGLPPAMTTQPAPMLNQPRLAPVPMQAPATPYTPTSVR